MINEIADTIPVVKISKSNKAHYNGYKHGYAKNPLYTAEYQAWKHLRARCKNPNDSMYYRYGGRGITVCKAWNSFPQFLKDMGMKPTPKHTIDRIDNDGNYEPSNCRWATQKQQQNNKSRNGPAKLNREKADIIRELHKQGIMQKDIAIQFDVCKQTICSIVHDKIYRDMPNEPQQPDEYADLS